ncbi:cap-associated protein Caf20p [[Candida] jaroonii]|uniref:Cap-associated protein Caf20p n=1 Tax=[Candida] jaroonii TaxID=467808 RepID=A0ACA9Y083_9ASCO|nr:cap-associated protein Caf20p [[Candida] jaroonii]
MAKYTEEQLFEIQEEAHIPQPEVLDAFNKLVETVSIELAKSEKKKNHGPHNGDTYFDEFGNERSYTSFNRRRGSHSSKKPLKKKATEVAVDDDGWATLTTKHKKSFGEDASDEKDKFRDSLKSEPAKVRPNNKKLGSSKAADPRETIADKQTVKFNAFEALGGDDDEGIEDDSSDE